MAKKMKPRYIDANLAKEALLGWDTDPTDEEIEYVIDEIPTADVVEVVRCRDCWFRVRKPLLDDFYCEQTGAKIKQHHFCSYGQRK